MATRRSSRLSAKSSPSLQPYDNVPVVPSIKSQPKKRKAYNLATEPGPSPPSTPKKSRQAQTNGDVPVPRTPDPTRLAPKPTNHAVNRVANLDITNAPLLSPETSRIITTKSVEDLSPSKLRESLVTTENILEKACAHLISVDPRMKPLIEKHHCAPFSPEGLSVKIDPFEALASGIISQQVSGAAAKSIKAKFIALFPEADESRFPMPSQVAVRSIEELRTAGLSQRKAEYIQGLAEKFVSGELGAQLLVDAPYEEIVKKLTAVRGLGLWSVEMFACFGLKRLDVFSLGDLGVQRGMAAFEGRDIAKLKAKGGKWKYMSEADMKALSDKFTPYRTLFMWYMWRVESTDVSTME